MECPYSTALSSSPGSYSLSGVLYARRPYFRVQDRAEQQTRDNGFSQAIRGFASRKPNAADGRISCPISCPCSTPRAQNGSFVWAFSPSRKKAVGYGSLPTDRSAGRRWAHGARGGGRGGHRPWLEMPPLRRAPHRPPADLPRAGAPGALGGMKTTDLQALLKGLIRWICPITCDLCCQTDRLTPSHCHGTILPPFPAIHTSLIFTSGACLRPSGAL